MGTRARFVGDPTKLLGVSWSLMKELCSLALNPNEDAKDTFRNFWKRIEEKISGIVEY